ncbi:unannotated protein [freshwater metagenome]|uniref:Unannotated protein n=1 Tax=freshwater metagenome TaxID=449393 RepID=A0A6J5ZZR0_9ZZZZ|nr:hypothetical protein [Actinomycetota bacterium]
MAKIFGGSASRLEMYALFVAAVILIGGGISGAVVLSQSDSNSSQSAQVASSNDSQTSQASSSATDATTQSGGAGDVSNLGSPNATTSSQTESLSTTTLPLCSNYFNGCGNAPAPTQAPSNPTSTFPATSPTTWTDPGPPEPTGWISATRQPTWGSGRGEDTGISFGASWPSRLVIWWYSGGVKKYSVNGNGSVFGSGDAGVWLVPLEADQLCVWGFWNYTPWLVACTAL